MLLPVVLVGIDEQNIYSMAVFVLNEASGVFWGVDVVYLDSGGC